MKDKNDFAAALVNVGDAVRMRKLLREMLTPDELRNVQLRWRLMQMLHEGQSQRAIARRLGISLCKITRGSRILKDGSSVAAVIIKGERQ